MTAHQPICLHCGQPKIAHDKPIFVAATCEVFFRGAVAKLTATELDVFSILLDAYPRHVNKTHLFDLLYGDRSEKEWPSHRILDVYASTIRRKFREAHMSVTIQPRFGHDARSGFALIIGA